MTSSFTRKLVVRLSLVGIAVAAFFGLRSAGVFAVDPVPVRIARVTRGPVQLTVTNSEAGTVKARRRGTLSPDLGGRVIELPIREGSAVETGDVLVRLDDATQRAALVLAERSLATAVARHRQLCVRADRARQALERKQALVEENIVSVDELELVQNEYDVATAGCMVGEAEIDREEAAIAIAEAALDKTALHAPFAGVVAELSCEVGEWISPSPPGLPMPTTVDLIDPTSIYISAPMDEVDSARIHAGQPAWVSIDSHPDRTFPGRVHRVAPYVLDIEDQNRTVEIEVELEDAAFARTLLPGTSADVEVILAEHQDALRIPAPALIADSTVLLLPSTPEGVLEERTVVVGLENWEFAEITSGLEEGDLVVVSLDQKEVRAGARVTVENPGEDS